MRSSMGVASEPFTSVLVQTLSSFEPHSGGIIHLILTRFTPCFLILGDGSLSKDSL